MKISRYKLTGTVLSVCFHFVILFISLNESTIKVPPVIIPIGLKVIPSIVKDDKVIALLPEKKKALIKKVEKKKKTVQKIAKPIVREGKSDGKAVSLKQRYLYELAKHIERNKVYPKKAKRLKQQGRVFLSFIIDSEGSFKNLKLAKSSSFKSLDKGALKLLKNISTFKPLPSELKISSLNVTQPITYQIQ